MTVGGRARSANRGHGADVFSACGVDLIFPLVPSATSASLSPRAQPRSSGSLASGCRFPSQQIVFTHATNRVVATPGAGSAVAPRVLQSNQTLRIILPRNQNGWFPASPSRSAVLGNASMGQGKSLSKLAARSHDWAAASLTPLSRVVVGPFFYHSPISSRPKYPQGRGAIFGRLLVNVRIKPSQNRWLHRPFIGRRIPDQVGKCLRIRGRPRNPTDRRCGRPTMTLPCGRLSTLRIRPLMSR